MNAVTGSVANDALSNQPEVERLQSSLQREAISVAPALRRDPLAANGVICTGADAATELAPDHNGENVSPEKTGIWQSISSKLLSVVQSFFSVMQGDRNTAATTLVDEAPARSVDNARSVNDVNTSMQQMDAVAQEKIKRYLACGL